MGPAAGLRQRRPARRQEGRNCDEEARRGHSHRFPRTCRDGFLGAMWADPLAYLDPRARASMSGLSLLPDDVVERAMAQLARDVDDGTWQRRNAALEPLETLDVGFRLVVADQRRPRSHTSRPVT